MLKAIGSLFILIVVIVALASGNNGGGSSKTASAPSRLHGKRISRSQYGKRWPLRVDSGTVSCNDGAITFTDNHGTIYWVNGTAGDEAKEEGWRDIHPIWADNPHRYLGPKKNIGPLIDAGLGLCR